MGAVASNGSMDETPKVINLNFPTNYSPENEIRDDNSDNTDSLKDFSSIMAVEQPNPAALSNDYQNGVPLLDFENSYKHQTTNPHSSSNCVSVAALRDSGSAMTHFIQA